MLSFVYYKAEMLPILLILPTCAALCYFVLAAGHWSSTWLYSASKMIMIVGPFLLVWQTGKPKMWTCTLTPPIKYARAIGEGLLVGVVMGAAILLAGLGPLDSLLSQSAPRIHEKLSSFGIISFPVFVLATFFISVLHSGFEEWYWRIHMVGALRHHYNDWTAIILGGIAFSGHHIVVVGYYAGPTVGICLGLVVGAAGCCWSVLQRRHGTIYGAWITHACCDVAIMWLGWKAVQHLSL